MSEIFQPFDYQQRAIDFCAERDNAGLFLSCGMGKTPITLKIVADRILDGKAIGALVVAPIRVGLITWPAQVKKWEHSAWLRCVNLRTAEGMQAWEAGTADIYIINPEMLPKLLPKMMKLKRLPADMLIIDELSVFKNPSSIRGKLLAKHTHRFPQRIALTGTPVPNTYLDLFAQIHLLDGGERLGKSITRYKQAYFTPDYMGYKFEIRAGAKEIIDKKLSDLCLVMLGDDYLDVPTCTTEDLEVTLPTEAKSAYKTLEKELLIQLNRSEVIALNAATLAGKLLQITSGTVYGEGRTINTVHSAKIQALKKLREKHKKEPIIVLTAYKHEMERVLAAIPGAVPFHEKLIPSWRRGEIHTMVCDPRSMSHGIDGLQDGGRIAVWMTLPWSNESYMQTNARLVRTGQSSETQIYRIICKGTIDDAVAEALRTKSNTQSGLLNALKALQLLKHS